MTSELTAGGPEARPRRRQRDSDARARVWQIEDGQVCVDRRALGTGARLPPRRPPAHGIRETKRASAKACAKAECRATRSSSPRSSIPGTPTRLPRLSGVLERLGLDSSTCTLFIGRKAARPGRGRAWNKPREQGLTRSNRRLETSTPVSSTGPRRRVERTPVVDQVSSSVPSSIGGGTAPGVRGARDRLWRPV